MEGLPYFKGEGCQLECMAAW